MVVNHNAEGYVDRVQCKVSKTIHKYKRLSKPAAAKNNVASRTITRRANGVVLSAGGGKSSSATSVPTSSAALEDVWFSGLKKWGEKPVPKYDPKSFYDSGEVVDHVSFGKGVVQKRRDNKVEVLFRTGVKVLPSAKQ